jgi:hypothetical protein
MGSHHSSSLSVLVIWVLLIGTEETAVLVKPLSLGDGARCYNPDSGKEQYQHNATESSEGIANDRIRGVIFLDGRRYWIISITILDIVDREEVMKWG